MICYQVTTKLKYKFLRYLIFFIPDFLTKKFHTSILTFKVFIYTNLLKYDSLKKILNFT